MVSVELKAWHPERDRNNDARFDGKRLLQIGSVVALGIISFSCGADRSPSAPSPPLPGFQFENGSSANVIRVEGSVRCVEAAHNLYVSAPDPIPSDRRTNVVSIIVGAFHGDGVYRNLSDNVEDPTVVLVELLDYGGPHDYAITAIGQSGFVRVNTASGQITGHVEGVTQGPAANSVRGDWTCRLSAPSGSVAVTPQPGVP